MRQKAKARSMKGRLLSPAGVWVVLLLISSSIYGGYQLIGQSNQTVSETLKDKLKSESATAKVRILNERLASHKILYAVYKHHNYEPFWVTDSAIRGQYINLLVAIDKAEEDGLRPNDYHREAIDSLIGLLTSTTIESVDSLVRLELLLTDAFLTYGADLYAGRDIKGNVARARHLKNLDLPQIFFAALRDKKIRATFRQLANQDKQYQLLKNHLARYRSIKAAGGWQRIDYYPDTANAVPVNLAEMLKQRFARTMEVNPSLLDKSLTDMLKNYQENNALARTGFLNAETVMHLNIPIDERIERIVQNMERHRWVPKEQPEEYVSVNIADYRLQVMQKDSVALQMKIIVGTVYQQTPIFYADMTHIIINPYWEVPYSIATKEILPILKRNPGYLASHHMTLHSAKNISVEINPYNVNWSAVSASNFPYKIRQLPGPWNALGRIKFMFPNPYSVYLHGTPNTELFERNVRTFSHGCMRVENPNAFAKYLLRNDPKWNEEAILAQIELGEEKRVNLNKSIQVRIGYWTCWVDEAGVIHFRDDIYKRDELIPV